MLLLTYIYLVIRMFTGNKYKLMIKKITFSVTDTVHVMHYMLSNTFQVKKQIVSLQEFGTEFTTILTCTIVKF